MKNILVVDDDKNVLEVIQLTLEQNINYQITTLSNPKLALAKFKENPFDLLITDMIMPELNGIELTELVIREFPKTKVLAISGGGESGKLVASLALDQAMKNGAANGIFKPFQEEELLAKVKNLLKE